MLENAYLGLLVFVFLLIGVTSIYVLYKLFAGQR